MTPTQVSYANMLRQQAADRETMRSNRAQETLKRQDIAQTSRRNDITEAQNLVSNKIARENMALTKSENAKQRRWQSKENRYNRDLTRSENLKQRGWQSKENKYSRENQLHLKDIDKQMNTDRVAQADRQIEQADKRLKTEAEIKRKERDLTRSENAKDRTLSRENKQKDYDAKISSNVESGLIGLGIEGGRNESKQKESPFERKFKKYMDFEAQRVSNVENRIEADRKRIEESLKRRSKKKKNKH